MNNFPISLQEKRFSLTNNFFTYVNISHCKLLKLKTTTYMSLLKAILIEVQFQDNNIDI